MKKKKSRVGEIHVDNRECVFEIIFYENASNCTIKYNDGTILKNKSYQQIEAGSVLNPNNPSFFNRGYIGEGSYNSKKHRNSYNIWRKMFDRCYSSRIHKITSSYKDCEVVEEWYNFQNFAKWFEENYIEGYHLDKDILVKGNKIYSPKTCCFVPNEINALIKTSKPNKDLLPKAIRKHGNKYQSRVSIKGVKKNLGLFSTPEEAFQKYKEAKENYIKQIANEWKDKIPKKVYEALYNHKVEITD